MERKKTEGFIQSGDAALHYSRCGSGVPIIMLHGNMQDSSFFDQQAEFLSDSFDVVKLDSRGHGGSSFGTKKLTIQSMSEDVLKVMEALKLEKAILFGFSDGGNIALKLALESPRKIIALILAGANIHPAGLKGFIRWPAEAAYHVLGSLRILPWARRKLQFISLIARDPKFQEEELCKIHVPALILAGQYDFVKEKHTRRIAHLMPISSMKIMGHAGHFLLKKNWEETIPIILKFLDDHKLR